MIKKLLIGGALALGLFLGGLTLPTEAQYGGYTTVAPQYTTVNLPTCSSSVNAGALAWDTTTTSFKICNGSSWVESGTFGGVTIGTASTVARFNAAADDLEDSSCTDDGATMRCTTTTAFVTAGASGDIFTAADVSGIVQVNPSGASADGVVRWKSRPDASESGQITLIDFDPNIMDGADVVDGLFINIGFSADPTGGSLNAIRIDGITADADAVETAILLAAGWDHSLSILGDGSATDDNITLGASTTADAQIYFTGAALAFDVDGGANNDILAVLGTGADSHFRIQAISGNQMTFTPEGGAGTDYFFMDLLLADIGEQTNAGLHFISMDLNDTEFDAATGSTFNFVTIETFTPDSHVDYNGVNIAAITGAAGTETAINVGAGWDYGLSILGDGSAVINNITLGLSQTADVQLYFDNAGFVIDLDGTAGNTMDFQIDGDAAASRSLLSLTGTFGLLDSDDTQRGLYLNLANANHTGTSNIVTALEIAAFTGDAQATETGIIVGAGYDLAARFDKPVHKLAYRQDFDGPCIKKDFSDFTGEGVADGDVNQAICPGDINLFHYRLDGAQATPFISVGGVLDIDNNGTENEGVEIALLDGAGDQGWILVGTSVAKYFRASVTITSVSGTDNFYIGWRQIEGFVDNLVIATYDTYGVHLINDTAGNLVIQTGDDTADGTDENDQVAAFGDGETHIFEVRVATNGDFSFFIDDLPVTESNATGAAAAGEILHPVIGLLNAADADTNLQINWMEVGEVI